MQKDKKLLPPLWIAFPEIERYSIGWRMGSGESYQMEWSDWYLSLDMAKQEEYRKLFPEPATWMGYWDNQKELFYENGEYIIGLWREDGKPKYTLEQIQKDYAAGKNLEYTLFWGHHSAADGRITKSCLSQWWQAEFWYQTKQMCCMEQFMMEQKAELFGDKEIEQKILSSNNPKQIKALGRKVKNFSDAVWDQVKYAIVLYGNYLKFSQNPALKRFLLSTGSSILAEASPYDGIWGIRMSEKEEDAQNPLKWRGENLLGFALMEVRDELKKVFQNEGLCDKEILRKYKK